MDEILANVYIQGASDEDGLNWNAPYKKGVKE
jgi:hypothetical protein